MIKSVEELLKGKLVQKGDCNQMGHFDNYIEFVGCSVYDAPPVGTSETAIPYEGNFIVLCVYKKRFARLRESLFSFFQSAVHRFELRH